MSRFLSWYAVITLLLDGKPHTHKSTELTLETLALCAGLWVVALFLPVGGSVANRMEKVTWCWGIEVRRFHLEQNLQVTLRKASYSETFSSDTCTVGKGDHTTPTNTVEVTDVSEKEESVLDQTRKPLCKYGKTQMNFLAESVLLKL